VKGLWRVCIILKEFSGQVFLSLILGVAAVAAGIGLLGTSAFLIASAAFQPSIAELQVAIVGVRFFGISRGVFRYLERLVSHSVNLHVLTRLREDFYKRVEPGAPANLFSQQGGDMLQRVMGDLETLENFYIRTIAPVVIALVILAGVSLFIGGYALQLGLIMAAGMGISGFIHPALAVFISRSPIIQLSRSKAAASARLVETLQGLEDIQVYNAQAPYLEALLGEFRWSAVLQKRLVNLNAVSSGLALLFTHLTVLLLLWVGIPLVSAGQFSGISLAVITLVALASFEAVSAMPAAALHLNASAAAANRQLTIGEEMSVYPRLTKTPRNIQRPELAFEAVRFTYPNAQRPTLEDIHFKITSGCKTALVGASGTGKTSLVNLLLNFEQPQEGSIQLNGVKLAEMDVEESRSWFAVLPQSVYLFNDSLRGNLALAKADASDEELISALRAACLSAWYESLPEGLDTWIGEHGVKMSGGERQRLAMARVLLQDRAFIILDEPTANLDPATARKMMDQLFTRSPNKGLLLITYDLGLLREMDEILVLSEGTITQRGRMDSLLKAGGEFKHIFEMENNKIRDS
jgi:ATP-binding cassette subfamily C protein CydC